MSEITLRYFDCRGRGQALRQFLEHGGVDFVDERIPFDDGYVAWARIKNDPELCGPFGRLPLLIWKGEVIAESLVISSFLQHELQPCENERAIAEATSSLNESSALVYELLNLDRVAPGADLLLVEGRVKFLLTEAWPRYDNLAQTGADPFRLPSGPTIAAFHLHEVREVARFVFGEWIDELASGLPALSSVLEVSAALPAIVAPRQAAPAFFSARPDQNERMALLRESLRSNPD